MYVATVTVTTYITEERNTESSTLVHMTTTTITEKSSTEGK